jgi:hypothetical protein
MKTSYTPLFSIIAAAGMLGALALVGAQSADARLLPPGHPPLSQELPAGHPPIDDGLPPGHPPINGGLPPGHPTIGDGMPANHPTRTQAPRVAPADPQDVRSIDAIISAYYGALSAPAKAERDWDRFRSLFIPEARLISAQPLGEGQPCVVMTPDQFIQVNGGYFVSTGYFETDIHRRTEVFGNAASVFSTYEARQTEDGEPHSRGINSMQLVFDGKRWWIATVLWDFERPDNPIPTEYLPVDADQQ